VRLSAENVGVNRHGSQYGGAVSNEPVLLGFAEVPGTPNCDGQILLIKHDAGCVFCKKKKKKKDQPLLP
jgi:hypothetical protein